MQALSENAARATASTVDDAFAKFLKNTVNLDPNDSKGARKSRDWLRVQLRAFDGKHSNFPLSYEDEDIDFGSFARRTQIRPLDDVDLIHCLKGEGATYLDARTYVSITVAEGSRLAEFCHVDSDLLSSTRVINKFVKHLDEVTQYSSATARRDGVAATLALTSYAWSFDIVPGFMTSVDLSGRSYYLIPNGNGHWMKTDPRLDSNRVSTVNQEHDGHVLNVVRLVKYWNGRPTMPSVPSYSLENLVLDYYASKFSTASAWVELEVLDLLTHISTAIYNSIPDPKGIQGDLNSLSYSERMKVSSRASSDASKANEARQFENQGDHKASIKKWGEVFGSAFPSYSE